MNKSATRSARLRVLRHGTILGLVGSGIFAACPAMAETIVADATAAQPAMLEEVIVTARRRSETLQAVPAAISAVGSQQLEQYLTSDFQSAAKLVPQLIVGGSPSGGGSNIYLRGVGSSSLSSGFDQSVGINIDGVQISRGRAIQQGLLDLAQMEVLRGPQALFFGKNSPGGVLSLTSKNPGSHFEAQGSLRYEFEAEEKVAEGVISGPVSDTLGIRLAARFTDMDGYFTNVAKPRNDDPVGLAIPGASDKHLPNQQEALVRGTAVYTPTESFDVTAKLLYSKMEDSGPASTYQNISCPRGAPAPSFGLADQTNDCRIDKKLSRSDMPVAETAKWPSARDGKAYGDYESYLASVTANYNLENIAITSITGYYDLAYEGLFNADHSAGQLFVNEKTQYSAFSQELRVSSDFDSPVNFMTGAYFQHADLDFRSIVDIAPLPADPVTGKYQTWEKPSATTAKTYSVFGQLQYKLTDELELAGGSRWTREEKKSWIRNTYVHPFLAAGFSMNTYTDDYADDDISSEATVTWRQSEDLTVYAAYKEGYKSGGFNNSAVLTAGLDRSALAYGPETASGFEVGVRPRFFNRALRLGLVAYDYDYKNLQVQIFDAATVSFRLSNAGKLRTRGLEFEAQYDVPTVKGLEFHGSLGYNKATYANYIGACFEGQTVAEGCKLGFNGTAFTSQDYDGRTPARAPRVSGVVGFSYQFPIGEGLDFALSGDGRYSSAYYYSESLQPDARQSAYWMYDASARVIGGDGRWELALIGKNLSDKLYVMHANAVPYTATGTGTNSGVRADLNGSVSRPREIWLQATYRY